MKLDFHCFHLHILVRHYWYVSQLTLNPTRFLHGPSMVIKTNFCTSTSAMYYDMSHMISVFHKV